MILREDWPGLERVGLVEFAHDPRSVFEVLCRFPCLRIWLVSIASPLREIIKPRWTESFIEFTVNNFGNLVLLFVNNSDWWGGFGVMVGNLRSSMWF